MSDREQIENTLNRFMNSFDLKDWAVMRGLLEPTIQIDYSDLRGGPATDVSSDEYVRLRAEALQHLSTQHLLTNLDVVMSDGSASVGATCMIHRSDGTRHFNSHAVYTFSLAMSGGAWRISGIKQRILWNEGDPTIHKGVPTSASYSTRVTFSPVAPGDFDELVALRIAAMRDSLERVGRFDPERARERLRKSFHPEHSEFVALDGQHVGFHTFRPADDGFHLDHLYVHPSCQSRGVGSHVMHRLLARADARQMPVHLGALRDSPSNPFYLRHGFVQTAEDEWDIYYVRAPGATAREA